VITAARVALAVVSAVLTGELALVRDAAAADSSDKMAFWATPRHGANGGGTTVRPEWFEAAAAAGIEWIRLHPDNFPAAGRDFLIGDADDFREVSQDDLRLLREALDLARENRLKVVLAMFSLPGCRTKQLNGDRDDGRIWREERYQEQALEFWRQLAAQLKGHPAIVAWNPLNEPHPGRECGFDGPDDPGFASWFDSIQGTTADLNRFNARMVAAIRSVDPDTPILLDGWFYADPTAFAYNRPVADERTLYALHNPGPWHYTTWRINKGRYAYPERMALVDGGDTERWTIDRLEQLVAPVATFAERHRVPAHRIVASEFWVDRRVEGAAAYLEDVMDIYDRRGWHWAFYAFRGDGAWTGLDYEIAPEARFGAAYWEAAERGEDVEVLKTRGDNPLWRAIQSHLRPPQE
jgi:endoglucanase